MDSSIDMASSSGHDSHPTKVQARAKQCPQYPHMTPKEQKQINKKCQDGEMNNRYKLGYCIGGNCLKCVRFLIEVENTDPWGGSMSHPDWNAISWVEYYQTQEGTQISDELISYLEHTMKSRLKSGDNMNHETEESDCDINDGQDFDMVSVVSSAPPPPPPGCRVVSFIKLQPDDILVAEVTERLMKHIMKGISATCGIVADQCNQVQLTEHELILRAFYSAPRATRGQAIHILRNLGDTVKELKALGLDMPIINAIWDELLDSFTILIGGEEPGHDDATPQIPARGKGAAAEWLNTGKSSAGHP